LSKKYRFFEIPVIVRRAHFSLAKNFLQSYQAIWSNLSARILLESEFFYMFIIHQSFYLRKWWLVWSARELSATHTWAFYV